MDRSDEMRRDEYATGDGLSINLVHNTRLGWLTDNVFARLALPIRQG